MSNPNFDHSEGDWEEFSSEPSWGESQWRSYLQGSDKDTERFLSVYNSVKNKPNHLDEVATLMGWDVEDISLTDEFTFIEEDEERPSSENSSATQRPTLQGHGGGVDALSIAIIWGICTGCTRESVLRKCGNRRRV